MIQTFKAIFTAADGSACLYLSNGVSEDVAALVTFYPRAGRVVASSGEKKNAIVIHNGVKVFPAATTIPAKTRSTFHGYKRPVDSSRIEPD